MKVRLCSVQTTPCLHLAKRRRKVQPETCLFSLWAEDKFDDVGMYLFWQLELTTVEGNINSAKNIEILDKNLWPVVVWYFKGKEYLFINDNAPVHRAHTVDNYKDQSEVTSMEWPAQSPDLNIIENICSIWRQSYKSPR